MNKFSLTLFLVVFTLLFSACSENIIFDHVEDIDPKGWDMNTPATFVVNVQDTVASNDFYLSLRHTDNYDWQNIFFFIKTTFPSNEIAFDTVECDLASPDGKWIGSGSKNTINARFLFKNNVIFPNKGNYKFEIFQGMREPTLKNIKDIGLTIKHH